MIGEERELAKHGARRENDPQVAGDLGSTGFQGECLGKGYKTTADE